MVLGCACGRGSLWTFPLDKNPNSVKGGCDPGLSVLYPADIRPLEFPFPLIDTTDIGLGNVEDKGEIGPYGPEPDINPGEGGALPL